MEYKYGNLSQNQIAVNKEKIRKQIFFLLLYVDPKTKHEYADVNVGNAFIHLLNKLGGMNSLFNESPEIMEIICLLEAARLELEKDKFSFYRYRKLILDAGASVMRIKEV